MITLEKFNAICWIWITVGFLLFPVLLKVKQPYGRHTTSKWGMMIKNELGWFLMELPALLIFGYFFVITPDSGNYLVLVAGTLWGLHYIHRALIFPFRLKTKGKKMPVIIVGFAIFFNTINGLLNGYWLANFSNEIASKPLFEIRLMTGIVIFLAGFVINQYHDHLLLKLRKDNRGYQIPYRGLFKYVSCPNYLGEIISWLGFFVVTLSLPALSFLIWTMVNLIPRALDHHKWYRKEFSNYPLERKAIIPYIL